MFYACLALGIATFGAGLFLLPGWYKLAWGAACLAIVAALPAILAKIVDPLNIRRIKRHLEAAGATDIEVQPFPNHYVARYTREGDRRHARCSVKRGKVAVAEREPKGPRTERQTPRG